MGRILAITRLTLKAAIRFRLIWVLSALLAFSVLVLPLFLKDIGKAEDFTQLLITYTLSAITGLLGLATLWLACGTLARDVEECQIQMVAVKPIARWEIWIGKWLGIMALNLLLLAGAGAAVYGMLHFRASRLTAEQQRVLKNEVLVARGGVKEKTPDFEPYVEKAFKERIKEKSVEALDRNFVRNQILEQIKQEYQLLRAGTGRRWPIDLGLARFAAKDRTLYVKTRFTSSQKPPSGTFTILWEIGIPETKTLWRQRMSLAPDAVHTFEIPPNLLDDKGVLNITVLNPNEADLLFQLEDGMEVLYPEGTFGVNYVRGLAIILFWLGLLTAIGLAAASILSFPVATFFAAGILIMVFSSGTMAQALEEGTVWEVNHETGVADKRAPIDYLMLPAFQGALKLISLAEEFSPIDALSTGRSIPWTTVATAFVQVVLLLSGIFSLTGIILFTRRELAAPQGTQ